MNTGRMFVARRLFLADAEIVTSQPKRQLAERCLPNICVAALLALVVRPSQAG